jgi:hypothetical protein
VSSRVVRLPPPGPSLLLRPQSSYALVMFLLVGVFGLFTFADVRGDSWGLALGGLLVGVGGFAAGFLSYRRCTFVGPNGLRIQRALTERRLSWEEIDHFEVLPHRPGRAERIGAVLIDGEQVALIHQDSKSLVFRPDVSRSFYEGLIDRIETVRRTAGR